MDTPTDPTEPVPFRRRCFGGILRHNNQFLVIKGRKTGIWSFPKGHSRPGELPLECARREIQEETGLQMTQPTKAQRLKGGYYFVFDLSHPTPPDPEDQEEVEEARWVTREEMAYLIGNAGIKDFLERVTRV
jgi:8-oxo-dGTP pyrophosphatase MutT (NUDIX family)